MNLLDSIILAAILGHLHNSGGGCTLPGTTIHLISKLHLVGGCCPQTPATYRPDYNLQS